MAVPVDVQKAADTDGHVVLRLPAGVQSAINMLPLEEQAKYMDVIGKMTAMFYHAMCVDIHYAARTGTPLFQNMVAWLGTYNQVQRVRGAAAKTPPDRVN